MVSVLTARRFIDPRVEMRRMVMPTHPGTPPPLKDELSAREPRNTS
jgi:hypothetical protein